MLIWQNLSWVMWFWSFWDRYHYVIQASLEVKILFGSWVLRLQMRAPRTSLNLVLDKFFIYLFFYVWYEYMHVPLYMGTHAYTCMRKENLMSSISLSLSPLQTSFSSNQNINMDSNPIIRTSSGSYYQTWEGDGCGCGGWGWQGWRTSCEKFKMYFTFFIFLFIWLYFTSWLKVSCILGKVNLHNSWSLTAQC